MGRRNRPMWGNMSLAAIHAYYQREEEQQCAAGYHRFGGWREDDDGRLYWMCVRGCGHQHRNDPQTPQELTNEENCQPYRDYQERSQRAQRHRAAQGDEENES